MHRPYGRRIRCPGCHAPPVELASLAVVERLKFWKSPDRPAAVGPAIAARHRRCRRVPLLVEGGDLPRGLLRRRRAKHVDELARLRLRGVRPGGDGHPRQAPRGVLGPGPVGAALRAAHLGHRDAAGGRRCPVDTGDLPGRPAPVRRQGGAPGRGRPGRVPGQRRPRPRQHLRHADDPAPPVGRRRHGGRPRRRSVGVDPPGRVLGRPGLPGQDDRGLAGPARLPARVCDRGSRFVAATGARYRGHGGHRRSRIAQLDDRGHPHALRVASLRRREPERLGLPTGIRLQRHRPGRPGDAEPTAEQLHRPADPATATAVVEAPARRFARPGRRMAAADRGDLVHRRTGHHPTPSETGPGPGPCHHLGNLAGGARGELQRRRQPELLLCGRARRRPSPRWWHRAPVWPGSAVARAAARIVVAATVALTAGYALWLLPSSGTGLPGLAGVGGRWSSRSGRSRSWRRRSSADAPAASSPRPWWHRSWR